MRIRSSTSPAAARTAAGAQPTTAGRRLIGSLLNIDAPAIDAVVARQGETGRLFGETAIELGVTSEADVERAIGEQQGFSLLSEGDARIDALIVAAFHPNDPLARSVRDLRGAISGARRADGAPVQTIALLGLDAASETAIVAANLAVVCAQAGYRTVLVDASLSEPRLHGLFRVSNRMGLSTLLSTGEGVDLATQATAIPLLSVIAAGPRVPNAPELLERQRLAQCADQLSDGFDLLIADVADAAAGGIAASQGLDAALIVVRRDVSDIRALNGAIAQLERHGTAVLGTILIA